MLAIGYQKKASSSVSVSALSGDNFRESLSLLVSFVTRSM
jgi:hypothetical protein